MKKYSKKQNRSLVGMFCIIMISILFSTGGLIFGIIQEINKPSIVIDDKGDKDNFGLIRALKGGKELNSLVIYKNNQYIFSKDHIESFSIYIFDRALENSLMPLKKINLYTRHKIEYKINDRNQEIEYKFILFYEKINKEYQFNFLIKLVK